MTFRFEEKDGMQIVETHSFLCATPIISWQEHEEAREMFAKTGAVPLNYTAKLLRGYLVVKSR